MTGVCPTPARSATPSLATPSKANSPGSSGTPQRPLWVIRRHRNAT
jgi:hypothetical protein